jgi:hypothetical protein
LISGIFQRSLSDSDPVFCRPREKMDRIRGQISNLSRVWAGYLARSWNCFFPWSVSGRQSFRLYRLPSMKRRPFPARDDYRIGLHI